MADLTEAELDEIWTEYALEPYDLDLQVMRSLIALAREGLAGRWRPIETAPKDTTPILIWDGVAEQVELVWWMQKSSEHGTWASHGVSGFNPTHWMPLPPAPQARSERVEEGDWSRGALSSVVSEGEPTPRTKCEPSGLKPKNGLQPQPSVGDTKELCVGDLVERLYERIGDDPAIAVLIKTSLIREAATTLKQQAEEIDGLKAAQELLSNRAHAQLCEAKAEFREAIADRNEALRDVREAQAEIERLQDGLLKAGNTIGRYREALEFYANERNYKHPFCQPGRIPPPKSIDLDQGNRARQALTDGEKE